MSDAALRREIVRLFEGIYATLISDYDRLEWINYELSMLPLVLAHVEDLPGGGGRPVAYESLFDNRPFRLALVRTRELRRAGVAHQRQAFDATTAVIEMIETAGRIEAVP